MPLPGLRGRIPFWKDSELCPPHTRTSVHMRGTQDRGHHGGGDPPSSPVFGAWKRQSPRRCSALRREVPFPDKEGRFGESQAGNGRAQSPHSHPCLPVCLLRVRDMWVGRPVGRGTLGCDVHPGEAGPGSCGAGQPPRHPRLPVMLAGAHRSCPFLGPEWMGHRDQCGNRLGCSVLSVTVEWLGGPLAACPPCTLGLALPQPRSASSPPSSSSSSFPGPTAPPAGTRDRSQPPCRGVRAEL